MWIVWLEKKILQTLGIILGIVILLITALHIYVVNNAEKLIEEIVRNESNNKLRLKVKNIKFNYFSKKVELENVSFYTNDSLDLNTAYFFQVDRIKLKVKALLPIFTKRELKIDSLALSAPKMQVTRLKPLENPEGNEVSIPHEMGKIYNSIMDALKVLEVKRFQFDEGQFRLINKIYPDQLPLELTGIHFHIEDFKVDTSSRAEDFPDSDKLVFWTKNQNITFPDGNHRLAFSRFRIKIKKRLIEIDSCTLIGKKDKNNQSGFSLFLDTLKLTNVDFKSLYEKDLIKADTVFCLNPKFSIRFEQQHRSANQTNIPNLDTLINQLTGDMQLAYIGVKNADVEIIADNKNKTTSFKSEKNNFEMRGLTIDHRLEQPVKLEGFDMAIRNYENYLGDSSFILRFDSVLLRESRILLSNFSINTDPYKDNRNIKVRRFALSGLSWPALLFDRRLVAHEATLINPDINYTQPTGTRKNRKSSNLLQTIGNFASLNKIKIQNGKIIITIPDRTHLEMEDADLEFESRLLEKNFSIDKIRKRLDTVHFYKGSLKQNNLMLNMEDVAYNNKQDLFDIAKLKVYNKNQTFNVSAKNITTKNLMFEDTADIISGRDISWAEAYCEINLVPGEKNDSKKPVIHLENVSGKNTQLEINSEKGSLSVFLKSVSTPKFELDENMIIEQLISSGNNLALQTQNSSLSVKNFRFEDNTEFKIDSLQFSQSKSSNTLDIKTPTISFIPNLASIFDKKPDISNLNIYDPVIKSTVSFKQENDDKNNLPELTIDSLKIVRPVFNYASLVPGGIKSIAWEGKNNTINIKNVLVGKENNQITFDTLRTDISDFTIIQKNDKKIQSGETSINMELNDVILKPGVDLYWMAKINQVIAKNYSVDSLGKNEGKLKLSGIKIRNAVAGSEYVSSITSFIEKNPQLIISDISGTLSDSKKNISWENLSYDRAHNEVSLDTFSWYPVMDRESYIAAHEFQTDYMTFHSGKITIDNIDPLVYLNDSTVKAEVISIENPYFTSYRDKRPPFRSGIIKPLPTKLIMNIPFKFSTDTIRIINGTAIYTELNDKNNKEGIVPLKRFNGDILNIKNFGITNKDTFRIRLNFYLLDSAWVRLRTRESYLDTASGFRLTLRMRPHSMLYLNEILEPLASVKVQSGFLDTLSMRTIGKDHLALGEMRMNYHDLKVLFLKNDTEEKKRFLRGLMTFIANSFVIKNENKKRVGVVYFPRIRDRSFINYYIKIAMSGVASSIGAKKNKRLLRRYKRQLKTRQLPDFEED